MTHDIAVIFSTHGLANVIFGQGRVGKGPLPLVTPVLV